MVRLDLVIDTDIERVPDIVVVTDLVYGIVDGIPD